MPTESLSASRLPKGLIAIALGHLLLAVLLGAFTAWGAKSAYRPELISYALPFVVVYAVLIALELRGIRVGKVFPALAATVGFATCIGAALYKIGIVHPNVLIIAAVGMFLLSVAASATVFCLIEYVFLRLLGLTRLGALVRVTYYEALLQPFTLIMVLFGITAVVLFAFMPFYTYSEDAKMYRDVAMSFCLLFTLPVMLFAASKVIDEEIENRTMLTLMSKPIAHWQVVVGKYLGVLMVCLVVISMLAVVVAACAYMRYLDDMRIDYFTASSEAQRAALDVQNYRAVMALAPSIVLAFLHIATLAAVAVAISTRWGLALNVTVVSMLYILANLTQFVDTLGVPEPWQTLVRWLSGLLPHLSAFDLNQRLIYGQYLTAGDWAMFTGSNEEAELFRKLPTWSQIWQYVGMAGLYAALYIGAVLSWAVALFRTRQLS